jgi:hypothetical protein
MAKTMTLERAVTGLVLAMTIAGCNNPKGCLYAKQDLVVVEQPFPLDYPSSRPRNNKIVQTIPAATVVKYYKKFTGKDYLMYEVNVDGRRGYIQFDGRMLGELPCDRGMPAAGNDSDKSR